MSTGFAELARSAFSYLESCGFRLARCQNSLLEYESSRSVVTVTWDPRSGELDASVGLIPKAGRRRDAYSIVEILGAAGLSQADRRSAQVASEERLKPLLTMLASDLRTHAQLALSGDRMYFRRLETFRVAKAETLMLDMTLRNVRAEAEKAWRENRFEAVVDLYMSVDGSLTSSEQRKLAYARQRIAKPE